MNEQAPGLWCIYARNTVAGRADFNQWWSTGRLFEDEALANVEMQRLEASMTNSVAAGAAQHRVLEYRVTPIHTSEERLCAAAPELLQALLSVASYGDQMPSDLQARVQSAIELATGSKASR